MHRDALILLPEPCKFGAVKEQAIPQNAWEDFVLKGEVPHHFHGVGHPIGISEWQTVVARLNDGGEPVGKLGTVGNDQMAACILPLSLHAKVSNLKQGMAHALAQVQARGAPCGVEGSLLQQGDCRRIGVSIYQAIRRVGGYGYPAPKVAHKQGVGLHGELTPHHPVLLLCCHQVSPYRPHVSMDGILLVEVTPLAVQDEADVDVPYVLQIHIGVENEQEGSGMAR